MPVIALLACAGAPPGGSALADTDDGTSVTSMSGASVASPAEAEDLDPAADVVHVALTAGYASHTITPELTIDGYAYNGQTPGPTIRTQVGDTVVVDFTNELDAPTTVHWHGVEVPNAMDGAAWVDDPVQPGGAFTYSFTVTAPGTFWYHPHLDVDRQIDLGLYGALIVEDPDDPVPERELVVFWDTWGEADDTGHAFPAPASLLWTANGVVDPTFALADGERARVRMINVSNSGYLDFTWPGIRHIASDQGLLPGLSLPDAVLLAPGDRSDFEWLAGEGFDVQTLPWTPSGGASYGDTRTLLTVESGTTPGEPLPWPFNGEQVGEDPGGADIVYVLSGGEADGEWLINGEAWPDVTVRTLALGEEAVVEVRNLSATEHPFHLHGQRFEVLSVDGVPPDYRTVEDTVNVRIRETVRLRLVPDNPGDWMAHCHLLGHEADGMMTVLRVE